MEGLSAEGQDAYQDEYEKIQDEYNKVVELISRYDEVFLDLIPGLKQEIQEKLDEQTQIKRYNNLLRQRGKNTMNFGTVINRYRQAIDLYNENNNYNNQ